MKPSARVSTTSKSPEEFDRVSEKCRERHHEKQKCERERDGARAGRTEDPSRTSDQKQNKGKPAECRCKQRTTAQWGNLSVSEPDEVNGNPRNQEHMGPKLVFQAIARELVERQCISTHQNGRKHRERCPRSKCLKSTAVGAMKTGEMPNERKNVLQR